MQERFLACWSCITIRLEERAPRRFFWSNVAQELSRNDGPSTATPLTASTPSDAVSDSPESVEEDDLPPSPPTYPTLADMMDLSITPAELGPPQIADVSDPLDQLRMIRLRSGRSMQFRVDGDALYPVLQHNQVVRFDPVIDASTLEVGTIVFVLLPAERRCYTLVIYEIQRSVHGCTWLVRDMLQPSAHSGACLASHILGRLAEY